MNGETTPSPEAVPTSPLPTKPRSRVSPLLWILLGAVLLFRIFTAVTDKGGGGAGLVKWTPPQEAPAAARSSGKPILYDFTADWCPPCKVLDQQGWGNREIAKMVNESFVPARVMDRVREDGRNEPWVDELHRRYRVSAFPTLVLASPTDGNPIAVVQGWPGRERLVQFLQQPK